MKRIWRAYLLACCVILSMGLALAVAGSHWALAALLVVGIAGTIYNLRHERAT